MYVVVNAAMRVDGKLASRRREQLAISGSEDFDRVDRIRAAADGVMVGVGTVLADDPHLTLDVTDRRVRLADEGIERLMIEGGGELIFSAFEAGLVDELSVFVGSQLIGGRDAPTLIDGNGFTEGFPALSLDDIEQLDDGVVLKYTVAG